MRLLDFLFTGNHCWISGSAAVSCSNKSPLYMCVCMYGIYVYMCVHIYSISSVILETPDQYTHPEYGQQHSMG